MASPTITLSDLAPKDEVVHFVFGSVEFDLGGSAKKNQKYETTDEAVLANATSHPWLSVAYPETEVVGGTFFDQLAPRDDAFTVAGRKINPNDPDEAQKAEDAKIEAAGGPSALEAGHDQSVAQVDETGAAVTLAATESSKDAKVVDLAADASDTEGKN